MSYNIGDLIGKTMVATKDVDVYLTPFNPEPFAYVKAGQPVGVLDTWIGPSPTLGLSIMWLGFRDFSDNAYYTKMLPGYYSESAIRQQGVLTTKEKQEAEENAAKPWYDNIISKYGPWVLGAFLASAAIKGYFSRSRF